MKSLHSETGLVSLGGLFRTIRGGSGLWTMCSCAHDCSAATAAASTAAAGRICPPSLGRRSYDSLSTYPFFSL